LKYFEKGLSDKVISERSDKGWVFVPLSTCIYLIKA